MTEYQKQAQNFLDKTSTVFKCEFLKNDKYFDDDKEERDIYNITLSRGNRSYTFKFGQSLNNSGLYWSFATSKTKNYIDRKFLKNLKIDSDGKPIIKTDMDYLIIINLKRHIKFHHNSDFGSIRKDFIHYPVKPDAYDVLACLTKYDPGDFENFCADYGYDTDSRKAEKIYNAVCDEFKNIQALYNDAEIEELAEIQ